MPFITVIVPVYNVAEYLDRCCRSIVNQTFKDFELILVDDGSSDGSASICDKWEMSDKRIRCIHKKNGGVSAARNDGIGLARGQYITFVDSDDWIEEDTYENAVRELKKEKVDILKFGYNEIYNGKIVRTSLPLEQEKKVYRRTTIEETILKDTLQVKPLFSGRLEIVSACMQLFSRELLLQNNIQFRKVLNEDPLFSFEAMAKARSYMTLQKPFYHYELRDGSATRCYIEEMYDRKVEMYKWYRKVAKKNELELMLQERLNLYYINGIYASLNNEFRKISGQKFRVTYLNCRQIMRHSKVKQKIKSTDCGKSSLKGNILLWIMKHEMAFLLIIMYKIFIRK